MGEDRARTAGARRAGTVWARRTAASWHTDLTDPVQVSRLKARVVATAAVVGMASMGVTIGISPRTYLSHSWLVPAATVAFLTVVAGWSHRRGAGMGDLEFTLLIAVAQVFATVATDLNQPGLVARVGLCLTAPILVAALFTTRQVLLGAQGVVALGCLLLVAAHAPASANPGMDVSVGSFALVIIGGTVRLLRDVALNALRTARAGEITDPLTGLANRRGLERLGTPRWRAQAREGVPFAVLVIDIDHFKRLNDEQGHAAGDEVLRRLGRLIGSVIRAGDLGVRLGGEEFLVLCGVAPGQGTAVAERIRSEAEREFAPLTVSIGVHEVVPGRDDPLPQAIWNAVDRSDQALYDAKNAGRNRVAVSGAAA
jgi:diguanylate cyclase (GGDEF)-like protein